MAWCSDGGFPRQMRAISSLFESVDLLIVGVEPRRGGEALPAYARVVSLRSPGSPGGGYRRRLLIAAQLPYYLSVLTRYIRSADVVHTPLPGDIPLLGMIIALLLRKRLIVRYGGSWQSTGVTTPMNRLTRGLMSWFAGGRNVMLVSGDGAAPPGRDIEWLFGTALDQEELERIRPDLQRGMSNPPQVVFGGRLSREKGAANLVRAIHRLMQQGFEPMPQVTIAGGGPERSALESLTIELGCQRYVRFVGQLNRTALSKCLAGADLCVQPSYTEGMSKVWLDAMAHGVPVLSTSVGSAAAVMGRDGERGWLVPVGDVATLAETLKIIISEPLDWPALRRRCRAYVEPRTTEAWKMQIAKICAQRWSVSVQQGRLVA